MSWTNYQRYMAPLMDDPFMLLYSQNDNSNQVLRPLHDSSPVDAKILREHAQKEATIQG
jgi:hypothetical protein